MFSYNILCLCDILSQNFKCEWYWYYANISCLILFQQFKCQRYYSNILWVSKIFSSNNLYFKDILAQKYKSQVWFTWATKL